MTARKCDRCKDYYDIDSKRSEIKIAVFIFAMVAVFMAALAVFLRTGYQSQAKTTSQKPATTSRIYSPSSASYQQVDEALTVKESKTTTAQNKNKESKLISQLHEIAESDREWLSQREKTTAAATTISPAQFKQDGKIYYNGYYYTYYSEKRLPGTDLNIPGRHSDGNYVRDEEGYIVLASCDLPKGTVIQTPFGAGKVYDYCPTSGTIDVYVSW